MFEEGYIALFTSQPSAFEWRLLDVLESTLHVPVRFLAWDGGTSTSRYVGDDCLAVIISAVAFPKDDGGTEGDNFLDSVERLLNELDNRLKRAREVPVFLVPPAELRRIATRKLRGKRRNCAVHVVEPAAVTVGNEVVTRMVSRDAGRFNQRAMKRLIIEANDRSVREFERIDALVETMCVNVDSAPTRPLVASGERAQVILECRLTTLIPCISGNAAAGKLASLEVVLRSTGCLIVWVHGAQPENRKWFHDHELALVLSDSLPINADVLAETGGVRSRRYLVCVDTEVNHEQESDAHADSEHSGPLKPVAVWADLPQEAPAQSMGMATGRIATEDPPNEESSRERPITLEHLVVRDVKTLRGHYLPWRNQIPFKRSRPPAELRENVRVMIVTALEEEWEAVFTEIELQGGFCQPIDWSSMGDIVLARLGQSAHLCLVGCVCEPGRVPAARFMEHILRVWSPPRVIMAGIAASIAQDGDEPIPGDLVAATHTYDYSYFMAHEDTQRDTQKPAGSSETRRSQTARDRQGHGDTVRGGAPTATSRSVEYSSRGAGLACTLQGPAIRLLRRSNAWRGTTLQAITDEYHKAGTNERLSALLSQDRVMKERVGRKDLGHIVAGTIATGDVLVNSDEWKEIMREELVGGRYASELRALDMESHSVNQCVVDNGGTCAILKAISDRGTFKDDTFRKVAMRISAAAAVHVAHALAKHKDSEA